MKKYIAVIFIAASLFVFSGCEDYLDKSIETDLAIDDVFKNFVNAQGFVEEMYAQMVDYGTAMHWQSYMCLGEDAVGSDTWMFDYRIDEGRYWSWDQNDGMGTIFYLNRPWNNPPHPNTNAELPFERSGIWNSSWPGIRKANIVIANVDELMVDATQDERNVILGQAYFFRAFFHHELMKFWGPLPYITEVLDATNWQIPRPKTWNENVELFKSDLKKAAELLPVDWNEMAYGQKSLNDNQFRITKGAAWGLLGKHLLFAASPLMKGSKDPYDYDKQLCIEAVDAFNELFKIAKTGRYELAAWNNYEEVFYGFNYNYPLGKEMIFSQPGTVAWFPRFLAMAFQLATHDNQSNMHSPTHNYIHNYFGMNDGLACEDSPLYDASKPFENRDSRFYKWIVVDGDQLIENLGAATGDNEKHRYAQFYDGGAHRRPTTNVGTQTGYLVKKWYPRSFNKFDNRIDGMMPFRLHMRYTDVYLMFAEAAAIAYGPDASTPAGMSSADAINALRDRAGMPHVQAIYLANPQKYMDEVRRERAVELSYEGHRWMDVRRWRLGEDMKYKLKTGLRFDKDHTYFKEEVIRTKVFDERHYWLPLPQGYTELYPGFDQNPGW
ncbi:MAG: RagB/SusD family nutrient uptake outer membrane protein [Cyclobacteriaceae bacterium]|nr:RagB/SusD family nutrient uptake outer membrane protein [Cyclobacteriaceae bacterium]